MSYISVSTWSLHRCLGPLRWTTWNEESGEHGSSVTEQPLLFTLLELPALAKERGYAAIEICHFHIPDQSEAYLAQLKDACRDAGIALDTFLVDYGDISSNDERRREADAALLRGWIDKAALAGAARVRIVAGEAPPTDDEARARSAGILSELAAYAADRGVIVVTENFKPLTSTADSSLKLLAATDERVRFITDFGNYSGPDKLEQIASTVPQSLSVHVKPSYDADGYPDREGLAAMLHAVQNAGYDGAYVLIYDGPGDMWQGLDRVKAIVEEIV